MNAKSKLQSSPAGRMARPAQGKSQSPQSNLKKSTLSALAARRFQSEARPNPSRDRANFDEQRFMEDMKVLQQAHQIIVRRNEENAKREANPDPDFNPQDTYSNFVNYTSVRELFDEVTTSLHGALPKLRADIAANQTNFLGIQSQANSHGIAIHELQEQIKELVLIKGNHTGLCKTVELESQRIVDNQEKVETEFAKVRTEIQRLEEGLNRQSQRSARQDEKVEACHLSVDRSRVLMQERFDEWFANMAAEQKRLQRGIIELEQKHKETQESVKEFNEQAKTSLDATIKAVFTKAHNNQKQFDKYDARLRAFDSRLAPMTRLVAAVEDLVSQKPVLNQHTTFLNETLPVLLHFTVCEALDKVVGRDYKRAVIDFEREKLRELRAFAVRRSGQRGLLALVAKVSALSGAYAEQNQGVLPFAYNRIGAGLPGDEEHVEKAHLAEVSKRYEKLLEEEQAFKEAVELACGDPRKVSPALLKHKLAKLQEGQVVRLRNAVANRRALELEKYDDFLLVPPRSSEPQRLAVPPPVANVQTQQQQPRKTVRKEPTGLGAALDSSRVGGLSTGSEAGGHGARHQKMPDKIFVVKTEQMRPYQRLDRKYGELLGTAVGQFVEFKATQLENLAKAAQMTLQLTAEIRLVKEVVQELQAALEESDTRSRTGLAEQDERLSEAIKAAEVRAKHVGHSSVKHLERQLKRLETEAGMQESKLEEIAKMVEQGTEKSVSAEQLEESVGHVRQLMDDLRADVEQGRQSVLDRVADMIMTHANEELAPKLEQLVEQRVVKLVGERFMEIQRRVDLNAEHLHERMKHVVDKNEEAIKEIKDDHTKAKEAQDEQLQAHGQDITKSIIRMQARSALQGQYQAAQAKILKRKEVERAEVADAVLQRVQNLEAESKKRVDGKPRTREVDDDVKEETIEATPPMKTEQQAAPSEKPKAAKISAKPGPPARTAQVANKEAEKKEQGAGVRGNADRAGPQTNAKPPVDPAKEAEEKQKQKQEKLKKQEEKRKKDRLIAQRQKEREERQAELQRQREEEEAEQAKAAAFAAKQKQHEEDIKAKYSKRLAEMHRMMKSSKTTKMGEQFLLDLGAQKNVHRAADAKLASKQTFVAKQHALAPNVKGQKTQPSNRTDKGPAQAREERRRPRQAKPQNSGEDAFDSKEGPVSVFSSDENMAEEDEASDESGEEFVNPFDIIKKAKQGKETTLSPEKFAEMLKPKVAEMQAALKEELEQVYKKIDEVGKSQTASLSSTKSQMVEEVAELAKRLDVLKQDVQRQYEVSAQHQQRLSYDMEDTKQRMDLETQEIQKLRKGVKKDITTEMAKITRDDSRTQDELRRLSALVTNIWELTSLLAEDQMLSQLLQEQDALDKKQIGLFGLKKNSQILGVNQYAMQNNLLSASQLGDGKATDGTEEQTQSKTFWDLRNKRKKYNEVVKGPVLAGQNARGADTKLQQKSEQYFAGVRSKSPDSFDLSLDPRAANGGLSDRSQQNDKDGDQLLNEAYLTRYNKSVHYNTIFLDRACASCQPGSAANLLTMLKLACLSYVSSPIRYGPIPPRPLDLGAALDGASKENSAAGLDAVSCLENTLSRARAASSPSSPAGAHAISRVGPHCYIDLQVCEVLQLKEGLLRKCQRYLQEGERLRTAVSPELGAAGERTALTIHLAQDDEEEAVQDRRQSTVEDRPRSELAIGVRPEAIRQDSATRVGSHAARRRALRGCLVEVIGDEERQDSADEGDGAWPRESDDIKSSSLRPVGNLQTVDETQCLDSAQERPALAPVEGIGGGYGPVIGRANLQSGWTKKASATAFGESPSPETLSRVPREDTLQPSATSPKFEIRVLKDLIRWRQQEKQTKSVQLYIAEMFRKERRRQQQQEEHRRRLNLKQSALSRKNEVDERLRTISVFSGEHEQMLSRGTRGVPAKNMASRSRSKDATRFRPVIDTDIAGLDDTTKTDLLPAESFSQAHLNTLISSSQQIRVGQLKKALDYGMERAKMMRSSVNVGANARTTPVAFSRQAKDNRSAYSKGHVVRTRTHSKNNVGIGASLEQAVEIRAPISRTLNTTLLSDQVQHTKNSSQQQNRPKLHHLATAATAEVDRLPSRSCKAKSTMAVKPIYQYLASPQGVRHFLPSEQNK